jgi:hypothetical protein
MPLFAHWLQCSPARYRFLRTDCAARRNPMTLFAAIAAAALNNC